MVCEVNDRGSSVTIQNLYRFSVSRYKMSPINLCTFTLTLYELSKRKKLGIISISCTDTVINN